MNKLRITIIALVIAVLFVSVIAGTALYYNGILATKNSEITRLNNQIIQLQNQTENLQQQLSQLVDKYVGVSNVKITSLKWLPDFNPIGSVVLENQIEVTVQNQGKYDVSGLNLTLNVSLQWIDGELVAYSQNFTSSFNEIHAGESKGFQGHIRYPIGYNPNGSPNATMLVGQLWIGNVLLDEEEQVIPNLYQ
jgi:predicted PurR-regulated permease PerM